MVWNKTPEETVKKVILALNNIAKSYKDISKELEISEWIVGDIARKHLPEITKKLRYSLGCSKSKFGDKNPMYGRKGFKHHNAQGVVRVNGYKTIFCPDWFTGKTVKSGRVYEHIYNWCKNYGHTEIPKGCVVHHIDLNIDNNSIENLQLLTISDHVKLHSEIRKVQRLSRRGVGAK